MTTFADLTEVAEADIRCRSTWAEREERARVVIRDGMAVVYAVDGREVVVRQTAQVESLRRNGRGFLVRTAGGETWDLRPLAGCGCGDLLKSFRPPARNWSSPSSRPPT